MLLIMLGVLIGVLVAFKSFHVIGPVEVGLVIKRFGWKKLTNDQPIAFEGEAGYQATLLMPGIRWKLWPVYGVEKHPWVQIPAGEIGVVIAQIGKPLPIGAKSAEYDNRIGNFSNLGLFMQYGGKGVQRPVLSPGQTLPLHPVAFLVITKRQVYGVPIDDSLIEKKEELSHETWGLDESALDLFVIDPTKNVDEIGIVITHEGQPLPKGDIASRIGEFDDIQSLEGGGATDSELVESLLSNKNTEHNSYQDFQAFINKGGRMGMQHDPILYGAYALNPFLVEVIRVPMLVVNQGEVAVVKSYVGLASKDVSGESFKYGTIVRPGHRGVWREALRTGKYAVNPRCYNVEIVPTSLITLNWADASSKAHELDKNLKQINGKSREGFLFGIDLQVQIHVPDTVAPRVISMVGTMNNLVNEVLQPAVGNYFRNTLQGMPAIKFIETRDEVQTQSHNYIKQQIERYDVETMGVYIQDVTLPPELTSVLQAREIANQSKETYKQQAEAQVKRSEMEKQSGIADKQKELAASSIDIDIKKNKADATIREAEGQKQSQILKADGEAYYTTQTGTAEGVKEKLIGEGKAAGFEAQKQALGETATALVNVATVLSDKGMKIMPEILVTGQGGMLDLVGAMLTKSLQNGHGEIKK